VYSRASVMIAVQSRKQAPLASHRQSAESQRIARATSGMACRTRPMRVYMHEWGQEPPTHVLKAYV